MTLNKKNWFARYYNWVTGRELEIIIETKITWKD